MRKDATRNNIFSLGWLDSIDRKLLNALQRDARQSNQALASKVGLSPAPCSRRIKRLHEEGIIERQVAIVDPVRAGQSLTAFISVELNQQRGDLLDNFENHLRQWKEVQQAYFISGENDYLLVVVCQDMPAFTAFIRATLSKERAVKRFRTSFVAERVKYDTAVHFDEGSPETI
jgi:Lrp/AsnC family leucine-responsive transcriptional regulator